MENKEIRLLNLRLLIHENSGKAVVVARLAKTTGSVISQIVSNKAVREVGDALARRLEDGCEKSKGWMDAPHPAEWRTAGIQFIESDAVLTFDERLNALDPELMQMVEIALQAAEARQAQKK